MKLLGLTGGVGMGKTTAARFLEDLRLPVIDTDAIAHELVEPGQPALQEIQQTFGKTVIAPDGRLHRPAVAELVFSNPEARRKLESILHPRIRTRWKQEAEAWRRQDRGVGVVVIPLLFETGAEPEFDAILCVACSSRTQQERLRPRGWTDQQIEQRIRAQWPVERKMDASDFVVWTEGAIALVSEQLKRIVRAVSPDKCLHP